MKIIILTHNVSGKKVVINWNQILFAAATESSFGEEYTEVAFAEGNAIPVKQTPEEIAELLTSSE